jgi:hypothetical protein
MVPAFAPTRSEWSGWQNQFFIPQQAAKDAKAEWLQLLNDPQPVPRARGNM